MAIEAMGRTKIWAARILGGVPAVFLLMDGGMKLFRPVVVVEASAQLGYPESTLLGIGVALLVSTLLYLLPQTAVLGALLLTGYLGGAVAAHLRVGGGVFPVLFPVLIGAMIWLSLWMRDERLRNMLPLRAV